MTNIFANFLSSLSLLNLGLAFSGVLAGIVIGALPGLSATMAVAILVPFTLKKMNIDPAIASSVFVTTITDVIGFVSFLGVGAYFL